VVVGRVDESQRGSALGTFTAFFDVGVVAGAPLVGAVAATAGYEAGFLVAAGLAATAAAVAGVSAAAERSHGSGRSPAGRPKAAP
jgi:predicted MFS family arabinose efflux permease